MPRRIRFIFGQTWDDMVAYVAHEEPVRFGFTPDADFPAIYCEKGILRLHLTMPLTDSGILDAKGGTVVNMVPDACTVTTAAGTYQAAGKCAHGSTPWRGENAIDRAMEQLPAESGPFAAAYRALFYSFAKLFLHSFTIIVHCLIYFRRMPRSTSVVVKPLPSNRRSFSANGSFAVLSSFISR